MLVVNLDVVKRGHVTRPQGYENGFDPGRLRTDDQYFLILNLKHYHVFENFDKTNETHRFFFLLFRFFIDSKSIICSLLPLFCLFIAISQICWVFVCISFSYLLSIFFLSFFLALLLSVFFLSFFLTFLLSVFFLSVFLAFLLSVFFLSFFPFFFSFFLSVFLSLCLFSFILAFLLSIFFSYFFLFLSFSLSFFL